MLWVLLSLVSANRKPICIDPSDSTNCGEIQKIEKFPENMCKYSPIWVFGDETQSVTLDGNSCDIIIKSNGSGRIRLISEETLEHSLTLVNVQVDTENPIDVDSIILENVTFSKSAVLNAESVTSDGKSLEKVESVHARFAHIDMNSPNRASNLCVIEIEKMNTEEPQIVFNAMVDGYFVFGVNSLSFVAGFSVKIFGIDYPNIEVHMNTPSVFIYCHSGLVPSVLLSPTFVVESGRCVLTGNDWPKQPKSIDWFWKNNEFYERNDRRIWLEQYPGSEIVITGSKIPVSIRGEDGVRLTVGQKQCGISGIVSLSNTNNEMVYTKECDATFTIGGLDAANMSFIEAANPHLTIVVEVCNFTGVFTGSSIVKYLSIDNRGETVSHATLAENGVIHCKMGVNFNEIYHRISNSLRDLEIPSRLYTHDGNLDYLKAVMWFVEWAGDHKLKMYSILRTIKKLGNKIATVNLDEFNRNSNYKVYVDRRDVPLSSLYYNIYTGPKALVCSNVSFDLSRWSVVLSENSPIRTKDRNVPMVNLSNLDIKYEIGVEEGSVFQSEYSQCLDITVTKYPSSAPEIFVYCDDNDWSSLSYFEGLGFHYVSRKSVSSLKKLLTNKNSKNIVFIALTNPGTINFAEFPSDINLFYIGLTIRAMEYVINGTFNLNKHYRLLSAFSATNLRVRSFWSAFTAIGSSIPQAVKQLGLFMCHTSKNTEYVVDELAVDLASLNFFKLASKKTMLVPIDTNLSLHKISRVTINDDSWDISLDDIPCCVSRTVASEKLHIVATTEKLDIEIYNTTKVTPMTIGYDLFNEEKLIKGIGIPLFSQDETTLTPKTLARAIKRLVAFALSQDSTTKEITFQGDWTAAELEKSGISFDLGDSCVIKNIPPELINKVHVRSPRSLAYDTLGEAPVHVEDTIYIRGIQTYTVPKTAIVSFENLTFQSKKSSFVLNEPERPVYAKYVKNGKDSSTSMHTLIVGDSLTLETRSYMSVRELTSPRINFECSLSDHFPYLYIESAAAFPHISVSVDLQSEDLSYFYGQAHHILDIRSDNNRCSELNISSPMNWKCIHERGLTSLYLNITVDIHEGGFEFESLEFFYSKDGDSPGKHYSIMKNMTNAVIIYMGMCIFIGIVITSCLCSGTIDAEPEYLRYEREHTYRGGRRSSDRLVIDARDENGRPVL